MSTNNKDTQTLITAFGSFIILLALYIGGVLMAAKIDNERLAIKQQEACNVQTMESRQ